VDFLEEAIYSFLQQDYEGEKEMVIVNDYPLQTLIFDHPEIRIINLDKTFPTIGDKENFAVNQCKGELIAVWDDDDIALANHMTNIAKYWKEDTNLLHWNRGVFYNNRAITDITQLGNSGIVYSKKIWEELGGHPLENAGYDMTFVQAIRKKGGIVEAAPPDEEVSWFYMWGGRGYHMSGQGTDVPGKANVIKRHASHVERERQQGRIPTGNVQLYPRWQRNYPEMLKAFNKKAS
jgi:hypothetical protein